MLSLFLTVVVELFLSIDIYLKIHDKIKKLNETLNHS
jgi:hypothetical protein